MLVCFVFVVELFTVAFLSFTTFNLICVTLCSCNLGAELVIKTTIGV